MDTIIPIRQWNKLNEKNFPRLHEGPPPHLKINTRNYTTYLGGLMPHQLLLESADLMAQMDVGPYKSHMAYKMKLVLEEFQSRTSRQSPGLVEKMEDISRSFKENFDKSLKIASV